MNSLQLCILNVMEQDYQERVITKIIEQLLNGEPVYELIRLKYTVLLSLNIHVIQEIEEVVRLY